MALFLDTIRAALDRASQLAQEAQAQAQGEAGLGQGAVPAVWDDVAQEWVSPDELQRRQARRAADQVREAQGNVGPAQPVPVSGGILGQVQPAVQPGEEVGPAGRTFDQVTGTDYLSPEERAWYLTRATGRLYGTTGTGDVQEISPATQAGITQALQTAAPAFQFQQLMARTQAGLDAQDAQAQAALDAVLQAQGGETLAQAASRNPGLFGLAGPNRDAAEANNQALAELARMGRQPNYDLSPTGFVEPLTRQPVTPAQFLQGIRQGEARAEAVGPNAPNTLGGLYLQTLGVPSLFLAGLAGAGLGSAARSLGAPPVIQEAAGVAPFFGLGGGSLLARLGRAAGGGLGYAGGAELGRAAGAPDLPVIGNPLGAVVALPAAAAGGLLAERGLPALGRAAVSGAQAYGRAALEAGYVPDLGFPAPPRPIVAGREVPRPPQEPSLPPREGPATPIEPAQEAVQGSAAPLPGQTGLFGETVDEFGAIVPKRPPTGIGPEEFRGEQGGLQARAFSLEEAPPKPGSQPSLEDALTVAKPVPAVPAGEPGGELAIRPNRVSVRAADLEYRPDLFQTRDAEPGLPYAERRVQQIVENWDPAQFTMPSVVPDPERPGKYIVIAGQHRTEAFRRVYGPDARVEVNVSPYDIRDRAQLARAQLEADQSNATTKPLNVREEIRNIQRAAAMGKSEGEIAALIGKSGAYVEKLTDISRLGPQAADAVVAEPALLDYAAEAGRGMRVYGISREDANGLFERIRAASKGNRPTVTALRDTIDKFGKALAQTAQNPLFDVGRLEGTQTGLLGMMTEHANIQGKLRAAINAAARAQKAVRDLAGSPTASEADRMAAERLAALGKAEEQRLRAALRASEDDVLRALKGDFTPRKEPQMREARPPATEPVPASQEPPPAAGAGGPPEPPARIPPPGPPSRPDPDLENLIASVEDAGAVRPDLLERRSQELRKRVAAAEQLRLQLLEQGLSPTEAQQRSRAALRGRLADPFFQSDAGLNMDALGRRVDESGLPYFTRNAAHEGLNKLDLGIIPAPHEVKALGQVFGPRLQYAVQELGDVFKVQERVTHYIGREVPALSGPGLAAEGALTAERLAQVLKKAAPDAKQGQLVKVAQRLIDSGQVQVVLRADGKAGVRLNPNRPDALMEGVYRELTGPVGVPGYEGVPAQTLPPEQPTLGGQVQRSLQSAGPTSGPLSAPGPGLRAQEKIFEPRRASERLTEAGRRPRVKPPTPGADWTPDKGPFLLQVARAVGELPAFSKAMLATLDRSAVLRQGGLLIRHGGQVWDGLKKTLVIAEDRADAVQLARRLHVSPDSIPTAEEVMAQIERGRWADVRRQAGLIIEDYGPGATLGGRNEQFMSNLARSVFGVKMAERSYVVYLNKLRADVFDSVVEKWIRDGRSFAPNAEKPITARDLTALADYLNIATGRGDLGAFEQAAGHLAALWFAPRTMVARFQLIERFFDPRTPGLVRKEMAKDLAVYVGGGITLLSLAKLSGLGDVQLDPRSTDFGKIRIGPIVIDIWGGYAQIARTVAQMLTGEAMTASGEVSQISALDAFTRYLLNKLAPAASVGVQLLDDNAAAGQRVNPLSWDMVYKSFTPLIIQDVVEAIRQDGLVGAATLPAAGFGLGVQTYPAFNPNDPVYRELSRLGKNIGVLNVGVPTDIVKVDVGTNISLGTLTDAQRKALEQSGASFRSDTSTSVNLNEAEQQAYQKAAGQLDYVLLRALVQSPAYQALDDAAKEKALNAVIDAGRSAAREQLARILATPGYYSLPDSERKKLADALPQAVMDALGVPAAQR